MNELLEKLAAQAVEIDCLRREKMDLVASLVRSDREREQPPPKPAHEQDYVQATIARDALERAARIGKPAYADLIETTIKDLMREARRGVDVATDVNGDLLFSLTFPRPWRLDSGPHDHFVKILLGR